jgi:hypothetical protein
MLRRVRKLASVRVVAASCVAVLASSVFGDEQAERADTTVAPLLYLPAMHVFRRHAEAPEPMLAFYGDGLGFERIASIGAVARLRTGGSEFKLCIMDRRPRDFDKLDAAILGGLRDLVVDELFRREEAAA